jgi:formylglycine-generating enzyme required for sulfatase activity
MRTVYSLLLLALAFGSAAAVFGFAEEAELPKTLVLKLGDNVTMEFVLLNAKGNDEFLMGALDDEKVASDEERPRHKVTLTKPFYLAKVPTTQEQYKQVIGDNPCYFQKGGFGDEYVKGMDTMRFPVETVSWQDAQDFCQELMKKYTAQLPAALRQPKDRFALPTEAQWEYACRAGTKTAYHFGDDPKKLGDYAWFGDNAKGVPHPAGKKENPWGLCDMHGNMWQWCADYYDAAWYARSEKKDPKNLNKNENDLRVLRGGSWYDNARSCRAACRDNGAASSRDHDVGFRVAFIRD